MKWDCELHYESMENTFWELIKERVNEDGKQESPK